MLKFIAAINGLGLIPPDGNAASQPPDYDVLASALSGAVFHLVADCPNEQMVRIDAGWIVAFVENLKVAWRFAVRKSPRHAVSQKRSERLDAKYAVSILHGRCFPKPACLSFIYLFPESFIDWTWHWSGLFLGHRQWNLAVC